tara:strand:- start:57 stop:569 length:513 start_codon:yes stop_codon:yes gene_type:complete
VSKTKLFLTLTGYQITWLACIFGEIKLNLSFLGIFVAIIYLSTYLYFIDNRKRFVKISLLISLPGYLFDTLIVHLSIYEFNTSLILGNIPVWMFFLWLSFSTLFDEILKIFKNYKIIGILLSGILGPMTYYIGKPIGIISIYNEPLFFIFMSSFWIFLMIYYLEFILKKN